MKNKKIIIGLVGKIASGKGTVAEYLEKKYNAKTYRFSTILRNILERLHYEISRTNMQSISTVLRKNFGEDLLAKVITEDVKKDNNKLIVIDGIRRMDDIKFLDSMNEFILIKITADPKTRYKRLIQRTENKGDSQKSYEDFLDDEQKETETLIPIVMEQAKKELNNNDDFEDLYNQIDNILLLKN